MSKISEMRQSMLAAGFYTNTDIEAICDLESAYEKECVEIAEQCEAEGYPANGDNYDLRCAAAREYYDAEIEAINAKYSEN